MTHTVTFNNIHFNSKSHLHVSINNSFIIKSHFKSKCWLKSRQPTSKLIYLISLYWIRCESSISAHSMRGNLHPPQSHHTNHIWMAQPPHVTGKVAMVTSQCLPDFLPRSASKWSTDHTDTPAGGRSGQKKTHQHRQSLHYHLPAEILSPSS